MNLLSERSRDILGGLALAVIGGGAALRAGTHLNLGSLGNMGPGFFPTMLGVALALCGAFIAVSALLRGGQSGAVAQVNLRAILCVIGSVAVFALTIRLLGLIPSAFLAVVVAGFADAKTKLSTLVVLAIGLSGLSWLVFVKALGMPLAALPF